jgi:hypothetical protein
VALILAMSAITVNASQTAQPARCHPAGPNSSCGAPAGRVSAVTDTLGSPGWQSGSVWTLGGMVVLEFGFLLDYQLPYCVETRELAESSLIGTHWPFTRTTKEPTGVDLS